MDRWHQHIWEELPPIVKDTLVCWVQTRQLGCSVSMSVAGYAPVAVDLLRALDSVARSQELPPEG